MTRAPTKIWQFFRQFSLRSSFWEALLHTGTGRNMTEPGRMKCNDTGIKITGMRLEWTGIWWPEPEKGKMWCFSLAFHFVLFWYGGKGLSMNTHSLLYNDQSQLSWAIVSKPQNRKLIVAVCGLDFSRLIGFSRTSITIVIVRQSFPISGFLCLSSSWLVCAIWTVANTVAEESGIWVLVFMFPF